ncbi:hypothetical protein FB45DRAFT_29753 [Roridomyces roridus]|uniref:Uncharacterized protein n=1 Tax=Roridomyces roridus TaxID=1738132 RepID=A0AAD7CKF2_9AGAR|nr:hypothetical protein FB45DRAFT_29753 [Roridomyces roridus]
MADVFRPRLPLDPFTPASPAAPTVHPDAPWPVYDLTAKTVAFASQLHVLLVLGTPSAHALAPILRSSTFTRSLLLIVTHDPPPLSTLAHAHPSIKILRLDAPLAPSAPAFALSLVQVLEAAANVARTWTGMSHDVEQLAQDAAGAFTVREPLTPESLPTSEHRHARNSMPARRKSRLAPSPPLDPAFFSAPPPNRSRTPSLSPSLSSSAPNPKRASLASLSLSKLPIPKQHSAFGTARPFDAIISFLPPLQPERAVLKQVVLTSTLATSFLIGGHRGGGDASASTFDLAWSSSGPPSPSYSTYGYSRPGSIASSRAPSFVAGPTSDSPHDSPPPAHRPVKRRSRFSLFGSGSVSAPTSRRASSVTSFPVYNDAADSAAPASIVHVLPASYRSSKLVGALGSFVASGTSTAKQTRGYVLAERALRDVETLLVGALEGGDEGEERVEGTRRRRGAWVAGVLPTAPAVVEPDEHTTEEGGKLPFGLPTPPASRHGSREGEETVASGSGSGSSHGQARKLSVSLPSASTPPSMEGSRHARKLSKTGTAGKQRRTSVRRSAEDAAGGMRRADSAPGSGSPPSSPPSSFPTLMKQAAAQEKEKKGSQRQRDRERGGKFFGGKSPGDFSLRMAAKVDGGGDAGKMGSSRRRWWAIWS